MIVARLVVVTSASVSTVHSQRWNCHLFIKADVDFVEVTTFAFVYNFNMGLHFFVYRSLHQPKPKIRDDGGAYLHQVTKKHYFI
jgi:hypothetical protein